MYCDTHAHLNFREYKDEIPKVIKRALDKNVKVIINIGSNYETSQEAIRIAQQHDSNDANEYTNATNKKKSVKLYAVVGCHPIHLSSNITETAKFDGKEYKFTTKKEEFEGDKYQKLIHSTNSEQVDSSDKVVGIGETGLDYFRLADSHSEQAKRVEEFQRSLDKLEITKEKQIQEQVFKKHIKLAKKNNLPSILHCRGTKKDPYRAYDEMLMILKSEMKDITPEVKSPDTSGVISNRGIIHCFGGNLKQAKEFIELGFYIGVNGIVTFKNARELQSVVGKIPLGKILLETDCPFLAPDPYRGKRNEPSYIPIIAQKIADLKNVDLKKVEKQTTRNAKKLFKIS